MLILWSKRQTCGMSTLALPPGQRKTCRRFLIAAQSDLKGVDVHCGEVRTSVSCRFGTSVFEFQWLRVGSYIFFCCCCDCSYNIPQRFLSLLLLMCGCGLALEIFRKSSSPINSFVCFWTAETAHLHSVLQTVSPPVSPWGFDGPDLRGGRICWRSFVNVVRYTFQTIGNRWW